MGVDTALYFRGGSVIAIVNDVLGLVNPFLKEKCTVYDVLAVRYNAPTIWRNGSIDVVTKRTMTQKRKNPVPYSFIFLPKQTPEVQQFYALFLREIRHYRGSEGVLKDGWWTWTEDESASSAEQNNVLAEAAPADTPAPAAPAAPAAAPVEAAVERAIQSVETEEKRQKGPACPDCGCASIFADKDDGGVIITCLNCGRQWRPGEHRSW